VSSAAAPYYNPNSNTGTFEPGILKDAIVAQNVIHFGGDFPSAVRLPIVSVDELPENAHFKSVMDRLSGSQLMKGAIRNA